MKIGLIGDVHQEDLNLALGLARLQQQQVDLVLCVGDIADGAGNLDTCCELLESHGVVTVRGNHDRWFLAQEMRDLPDAARLEQANPASREWLSSLPATQTIDTPAGRALLCHGMADSDMTRLGPDDTGYALESNTPLQQLLKDGAYSIVISGHTHQPMQRRIDKLTFVNPGTLHRSYAPCVAVFDALTLTTEFIPIPKLDSP